MGIFFCVNLSESKHLLRLIFSKTDRRSSQLNSRLGCGVGEETPRFGEEILTKFSLGESVYYMFERFLICHSLLIILIWLLV